MTAAGLVILTAVAGFASAFVSQAVTFSAEVKEQLKPGGALTAWVGTVTGWLARLGLSPEAIVTPAEVDGRADIYALGAVGYFLLSGEPPFAGRTLAELCGHHLHSTPVAPSLRLGRPVPDDLERVVLGCLAKAAAAIA